MKLRIEKLPQRILLAAFGLMVSGIGVGIFLYANLGVDPASVFQLGLAKVFSIRYGTASAFMNVVILAVVFVIDRKYINIASFLAIFLIGYTADYTNIMITTLLGNQLPLMIRGIMMLIGCVIMASGIPLYIQADLGVGAVDMISEIISNRTKIAYRIVRITGDGLFVVLGFLMGGTVGIGTVVAVFMTGPIVQKLRPILTKYTKKFVEVKHV